LNCRWNELTSLEGSEHSALAWLDCGRNRLKRLDVSIHTSLQWLDCSGNQLTDLDVRANPALAVLECSSNELTSLDASYNPALTSLNCRCNKLKRLQARNHTALTSLNCEINELTSLDVSKQTALEALICASNFLTALDLSKNTTLTHLDCRQNRIKSLDVINNPALKVLRSNADKIISTRSHKNIFDKQINFMNELWNCSTNTYSLCEFYGNSIENITSKHTGVGYIIIGAGKGAFFYSDVAGRNEININRAKELMYEIVSSGFSFTPVFARFIENKDRENEAIVYESAFIALNYNKKSDKEKDYSELFKKAVEWAQKYQQSSFLSHPPAGNPQHVNGNGEVKFEFSDRPQVTDLTQHFFTDKTITMGFSKDHKLIFEGIYINPSGCTYSEKHRRYSCNEL
jgi:hypothetical protein